MSTAASTTPTPSPSPRAASPTPPPPASGALATGQGATHIADTVVSKIAGVAAREVTGIHRLGGGASRALGSLRERIPGASTSASQGVSVEVGEKQAAVDIDVVVEYGVAIADLANAVRRNVTAAVQGMTGLEVVEVNLTVNDVHLPSDDADDSGSGGGSGSGSGDAGRSSAGPRVR
ncbi:MAG: Asp23/Gls24 family envelope stress response protein [Pseudonocardia sediminis]